MASSSGSTTSAAFQSAPVVAPTRSVKPPAHRKFHKSRQTQSSPPASLNGPRVSSKPAVQPVRQENTKNETPFLDFLRAVMVHDKAAAQSSV